MSKYSRKDIKDICKGTARNINKNILTNVHEMLFRIIQKENFSLSLRNKKCNTYYNKDKEVYNIVYPFLVFLFKIYCNRDVCLGIFTFLYLGCMHGYIRKMLNIFVPTCRQ